LDPDRVIMSGAFAESHRTVVDSEESQIVALSRAIKDHLKAEIIAEINPISNANPMLYGDGAAGI